MYNHKRPLIRFTPNGFHVVVGRIVNVPSSASDDVYNFGLRVLVAQADKHICGQILRPWSLLNQCFKKNCYLQY
jgi:hypothetical protein